MKIIFNIITSALVLASSILFFSFNHVGEVSYTFPYKQSGLTERQAAAHLLSRFTFGATPGQVDEVVKFGLENWFRKQLDSELSNTDLDKQLANYEALQMTNSQIVQTYIQPAQVLKMAIQSGSIDKDSINKTDKVVYRKFLLAYMQQHAMKPQAELFRQLANQKILRAAYSNNQLQEVLTDFWFNHFNVSITKKDCAEFILGYEKDVIRPNVLGAFDNLLLATAKSPAMLYYLDNFSSAASAPDSGTSSNRVVNAATRKAVLKSGRDTASMFALNQLANKKKTQGLNENYAREVMELHTLGVDGGYTQSDVTQAARILTGWTVYPVSNYGRGNAVKTLLDRIGEDKLEARGFIHDGDFLFAANRHDKGEKVVLGKTFTSIGYQNGVDLLKMLAHHPATARFISKKLAIRFVNDNPPSSLVNKMAKSFTATGGNIREVLLTMVNSPEFWSDKAVREKTKSPFELAISSIRSLHAEVKQPYQLYNWIDKMGQKLYYYQAPTGFPDKGQYWINTGALLSRMNFGLALASEQIPGVKINLLQLNGNHEPGSANEALLTFGTLLMPERDLQKSIASLSPLLHEPQLREKIENKVRKEHGSSSTNLSMNDTEMNVETNNKKPQKKALGLPAANNENNNMLSQAVGIIIGSPEFQRR